MHQNLTLPELEEHCLSFERLWNTQLDSLKRPGPIRARVHELLEPSDLKLESKMDNMTDAIEALQIRPANNANNNRGEYKICWNCKDMGHTFMDCMTPVNRVFCFGCGADNTYKPQCPKCTAGNEKRDVLGGVRRPNPFTPKTI